MGINANSPIITGKIEQVYFSIGEVANLFGVATSHIRFYDSAFNLRIKKNKRGERYITRENIEKIGYAISLSKTCKLEGIRLILEGKAKFIYT